MTSRPSLARLQARHVLLVGLAALTSHAFGRPGPGGVLLGGGAIGLSLLLYAAGLQILLRRMRPHLAIGVLFVKLLALVGLGWLAFGAGRVCRPDPLGFAVGLTCFPAAALWEAMHVRGG